jgi:hypothetical protein
LEFCHWYDFGDYTLCHYHNPNRENSPTNGPVGVVVSPIPHRNRRHHWSVGVGFLPLAGNGSRQKFKLRHYHYRTDLLTAIDAEEQNRLVEKQQAVLDGSEDLSPLQST